MFGKLFGKKDIGETKENIKIPWVPLTSTEQLDEIIDKSALRTQMLFKHSTTCGISRMVLNRFGKNFDFKENQVDLYYLDLHSFRGLSNEIASRFQVAHQSPQLLVVKNGVVVAHDSHGGINDLDLKTLV
ncbi:bacillithiol system redox-active protein YtxJ [Maribacter algicola]|uniref:Bacillithiol system redox-active protein YtxJ n=1 Tax=Meishania litoralis TaxID=3434685 RepID=A0ACC7LM91_9FLAO